MLCNCCSNSLTGPDRPSQEEDATRIKVAAKCATCAPKCTAKKKGQAQREGEGKGR